MNPGEEMWESKVVVKATIGLFLHLPGMAGQVVEVAETPMKAKVVVFLTAPEKDRGSIQGMKVFSIQPDWKDMRVCSLFESCTSSSLMSQKSEVNNL